MPAGCKYLDKTQGAEKGGSNKIAKNYVILA